MTRAELAAIQMALNALGYSAGAEDGLMGKTTRAAVSAFQRDQGLYVDGIPGEKTQAALTAAKGKARSAYLDPVAFAAWAPDAVPNTYEALEAAIRAYPALANPAVLDDWLGQMWVESAAPGKSGFSTLTENLNYSVEALKAKFGRHRISLAEADLYGRKPGRPANQEAIANIIYGGEWGREHLGNTKPGDGWKNRGSGVKQITGEDNIRESGFTPEELRTDIFKSCLAAAKFFISHGCVAPALRGDITEVTRRVNGGKNGLAERMAKTASARKVIL